MKVVGLDVLDRLKRKHPAAASSAAAWLSEMEEGAWRSPQDLGKDFPSADFLGQGVVVFNICGNRFRIAARVSFQNSIAKIMQAGNHAEYNRWDLRKI